jgi:Kdo2-lipid IVA lauroyltransferase/acyltransferase
MGNRRKRIGYQIEFLLARSIGFIAQVLPLKCALFIGDRIGDLFYFVIRSRRKVALDNLAHAFPEKNESERRKILWRNYQHFGRVMIEFARMPLLQRETILQTIPIHNKEYIDELIKQDKGVLIFSGHFGNWEYLAATMANVGLPLYCVFKEQKNLTIDQVIKQYRMGIGLLPLKVKGGAARGIITAIKEKAMILILIDQDSGKRGVFIDFFGRPASTTDGPATVLTRYKVPAIMAFAIRGKNGLLEIYLEKFPSSEQFSDDEAGHAQFIKHYNRLLEKYIRQYPEQWFWLHRRWKTQPVKNEA